MIATRPKRRGPRPGKAATPKTITQDKFTSRATRNQSSPVARLAATWFDAAERTVSAFYKSIAEPVGPEVRFALESADEVELHPEHFPSAELWNLTRVLIGCAESGLSPTVHHIRVLAESIGADITTGGGDERAELRRVLECETSAAGLWRWAAIVLDCANRAKAAAVLRGSYQQVMDRTEPLGVVLDRLAGRLFASCRKGVADVG